MSRLIDADALLAEILEKPNIRYSNLDLIKTIGDSQTVDAVPKSELYELFDRITTAWNGKQRFFRQDDGTIYDRNKCDYVKSLDDAVNRFCIELA